MMDPEPSHSPDSGGEGVRGTVYAVRPSVRPSVQRGGTGHRPGAAYANGKWQMAMLCADLHEHFAKQK